MITVVHSEDYDWVGIYDDDVLMIEAHSLTPEEVLTAGNVKFETREWKPEEYESMLPTDLKEL